MGGGRKGTLSFFDGGEGEGDGRCRLSDVM